MTMPMWRLKKWLHQEIDRCKTYKELLKVMYNYYLEAKKGKKRSDGRNKLAKLKRY